jgi:acyl-CoA synthetase (AMP-forming)/AMP-acid ligase II
MDAPVNIAAALADRAAELPQTLAIIEPRRRAVTFRELHLTTDALALGLAAVGVTRGMRTVVMVPPSLEFYALTFALFKLGAVVVLIDPGMGVAGLGQCLAEAEPGAFIGVGKAHLARVLFGWGRRTVRIRVAVGAWPLWGTHSLPAIQKQGWGAGPTPEPWQLADTTADELAAILFTSGSTGVAKGAMYTHAIFAEQVRLLREVYGIQPGEVDVPTFPLFGLFGPALGMTAVIPQMDFTRPGSVDPVKIFDAVTYYQATNLFGSPALIRRVGKFGAEHGVKLPSLRRVISAGAPVPVRAIEQFAGLLAPEAQVHTPYGATEALPVATIGSREILGETGRLAFEGRGVCVGRPVPGVRVEVIRISDEPIPNTGDDLRVPVGTIGEIAVQGRVVTRSYYNREEQTRLAKMADPAGGFWHRMGDVGYLDASGRLWFCGRKSQRVVTEAGTLFTIPCEGVFNAHPTVLRSALVGVRRAGGMMPVLCVERDPDGPALSDDRLREELAALGAAHDHTREIRTILFHPAFPVDIRHNAKIFREKLAAWAARQLP